MCGTWLTVQHSREEEKNSDQKCVIAENKYVYNVKLIILNPLVFHLFLIYMYLMTAVFFIPYSTYKILCSSCVYAKEYNFCI